VGLEAVLEGNPWMICNSPIIIKKWSMGDGISLIVAFIGKPIMLDSYTSFMCNDSWGRSSFARYLIEVNSEADLVDVVTIGIPSQTWDVMISLKKPFVWNMNGGRPGVIYVRFLVMFMTSALKRWSFGQIKYDSKRT
nr:hypothetical protein [Tanacetum cinerariifolium]